MVGVQVDKSSESKEEYDAGDVLPIFAVESIANTKDISSTVYAFAEIVNASFEEPCVGKLQARFCRGGMVMKQIDKF